MTSSATPSLLFTRLLNTSFHTLPEPLRQLHCGPDAQRFTGQATVERGGHPLTRLAAWLTALPPAADNIPLTFSIKRAEAYEIWTRDFNGHVMHSQLTVRHGYLHEQLGPVTFVFSLKVADSQINWQLMGVRFLRIPLPLAWFREVHASEAVIDGRYSFDIRASLPVLGLLIRYRGWLMPA